MDNASARNYAGKDPNAGWQLISKAINEILTKNASLIRFEEIYRNVYYLVSYKQSEFLYDNLADQIQRFLTKIAPTVASAPDEFFLKTLNSVWKEHHEATLLIRDILMYLERIHCVDGVLTVYELGISLFYSTIFKHNYVGPRFIEILLTSVRKFRDGEIIDNNLLANLVTMLVNLGTKRRNVYEIEFERRLLQETKDFYRNEAKYALSNDSLSEYLIRTETKMSKEREQALACFPDTTAPKIEAIIQREFLERQLNEIFESHHTELLAFFQTNATSDIIRLFKLFSYDTLATATVLSLFGAHIRDTGSLILNNAKDRNTWAEAVFQLIELKDSCELLLLQAFQSQATFKDEIDRAFMYFLKENDSSFEKIAYYFHTLLQKRDRSEHDEAVKKLEKSFFLFKSLEEKDRFMSSYQALLSNRLLSGSSKSEELEALVIRKLKEECGGVFVSNLEKMNADIKSSKALAVDFKKHIQGRSPSKIELFPQIISTGHWKGVQITQTILPTELTNICTLFSKFYCDLHSGRILKWQPLWGTGDLLITQKTSRREAKMTTPQICVAYLFNNTGAASISFEKIQTDSGLPPPVLKKILSQFCNNEILKRTAQPGGNPKTINPKDLFAFRDVSNQKKKLDLTEVGKTTAAGPIDENLKKQRSHQVQCSIVRIAKMRQIIPKEQMVQEVVQQLRNFFQPSPAMIKAEAIVLAEKEYLEITDTTYVYRP